VRYAKPLAFVAISAAAFGPIRSHASPVEIDVIADNVAHLCNACSPAKTINMATSLGHGNHYVYDLEGNAIHLFQVECQPIPGGTQCYADEQSVPADAQSTFVKLRAAYTANGHSITFGSDVDVIINSPNSRNPDGSFHDDGYVNAYDTITMPAGDFLVTKCLSDFACTYSFTSGSPAFHVALVSLLQAVKSSIIDFSGITVVFTVTFHDGSQVNYKYDFDAKVWKKVPGTARDAHHNLIDPIPAPPLQIITGGGPSYDGRNIAHIIGTLVPSDPHCVALEWDGEHLTCILSP
jgi:hypothetical protein